MKKFISFSGGVESSTLCVLFGKEADAIFADTGYEHQKIYDRIKLVEKWCKDFHRADFKIHLVRSKEGSIPDYVKKHRFYPSFSARYCTRIFKIEPIDNFLRQFKETGCEIMIGLNAEEKDQRTGNHGLLKFVRYSYPLIEHTISRNGCIHILTKANLLPDFPVYMQRGGCIGCFYKSRAEYVAMATLNPIDFEKVRILEQELNTEQSTRDGCFTILPGCSMNDIKKQAEAYLFSPEEIYPVINNVTKCGVFCNR